MAVTTGRFRMLRGTAAQFSSLNPVLQPGEPGYTTDTRVLKIGDGTTAWNSLSTITAGTTDHGALTGLTDNDHPQYALVADAVPLATTTPATEVQNGYAGTAATASRGDHQHPYHRGMTTVVIPPATPGNWWLSPFYRASGTATTSGWLIAAPYPLFTLDGRPMTFTNIGVNVQTAGSSDSTCKIGLYPTLGNGTPNWAGKLIDVTVTTGATTGEKSTTVSSVVVPSGMYWAAVLPLGTTSPLFYSIDDARGNGNISKLYHFDAGGMDQAISGYKASQTVLPTTDPGLATLQQGMPNVYFKVS
jgi:hypothetical protein